MGSSLLPAGGGVTGVCEELGGTSEELGGTSEELGGTSEELGGTSEELGGTSEELGGTSEELGGTSEELGGTSEELGGVSGPGFSGVLAPQPGNKSRPAIKAITKSRDITVFFIALPPLLYSSGKR